ncbi:hypothetical protein [Kibdelosporangium aridum]|uniref:Uncharacterized protein n=1 Tax=Kibdelosporangium aridum TaxID=2030 RepID=A0A1Y5Y602_KIBAR|nr:hypothetical protein [Kibdelosporangium aridum]SMD25023.1 hypothetical protein SAMN05661093_08888 [Kibdelosporangium aridum]
MPSATSDRLWFRLGAVILPIAFGVATFFAAGRYAWLLGVGAAVAVAAVIWAMYWFLGRPAEPPTPRLVKTTSDQDRWMKVWTEVNESELPEAKTLEPILNDYIAVITAAAHKLGDDDDDVIQLRNDLEMLVKVLHQNPANLQSAIQNLKTLVTEVRARL